MYEYSKFRDRSTFERAGKQLSFWTTGWKNISFLALKSWKNMYFCPKRLEFCLLIDVVTMYRYVKTESEKDTLHETVGKAYETSSSATEESTDFRAEDDQEVEVSTHVDKESFVITTDGSQNKKRSLWLLGWTYKLTRSNGKCYF